LNFFNSDGFLVCGFLLTFFFHLHFHRAADLVVSKLREMGKVSQEDITLAMKEFDDLDQSESSSAADPKLPEPSQTEKK
jgi:hypothetical protein